MLFPLFLCVKCLIVPKAIIPGGIISVLMADPNRNLILRIRKEHRVQGPVWELHLPGTLNIGMTLSVFLANWYHMHMWIHFLPV